MTGCVGPDYTSENPPVPLGVNSTAFTLVRYSSIRRKHRLAMKSSFYTAIILFSFLFFPFFFCKNVCFTKFGVGIKTLTFFCVNPLHVLPVLPLISPFPKDVLGEPNAKVVCPVIDNLSMVHLCHQSATL